VTISAADADGSIVIPSDEETVSFSNVTFFEVDETLHLSDVADIAVQQEAMNGVVNTLGANCFYMVRIEGAFDAMKVRSEYKQEKSCRAPDVALEADQTEFDYENVRGTMVGVSTRPAGTSTSSMRTGPGAGMFCRSASKMRRLHLT